MEGESKTMTQFKNVEIGMIVSLGTFRSILKTLSVDGKRWWIVCTPRDAMKNGGVTVGFADQHYSLDTVYFRIPIIDEVPAWSKDRFHLLFDPSVIVDAEPYPLMARGRFVRNCVGDWERFFFPVKAKILERLRSAGEYNEEDRAKP